MNRTFQILLLLCLLAIISIQLYKGLVPRSQNITVCPVNAITMENGKAVINEGKCIGCRRCVDGIVNPSYIPKSIPQLTTNNTESTSTPTPQHSSTPTLQHPNTPTPHHTSTPAPQHSSTPTLQHSSTPSHKSHKVDANKCIGCQLCVPNCPVNAITMVNGKAVIDPSLCINCGICINGNNDDFTGCPVAAITAPE